MIQALGIAVLASLGVFLLSLIILMLLPTDEEERIEEILRRHKQKAANDARKFH